jgi:hypothetical protein
MKIGKLKFDLYVDTLLNEPDALLGLAVLNGEDCMKEPAYAVQIGFFFITFTLTISNHY